MTTVIRQQKIATLALAAAGMCSTFCAQAGPEVSFYVTKPLGGNAGGHVLGLRLDRSGSNPSIRTINPDSPLNRRALLDLQLGANSAVRLELARRLTWDISSQQWRPSSQPAFVNLHIPTKEPQSEQAHSSAAALERAALAAPLPNPLQDASRKPLIKPFAVEP